MLVPTADQIRALSEADWVALNVANDAKLDLLIAIAVSSLGKITGLSLDRVPVEDEPLIADVIRGMTEALAYQRQPDMLETLSDWSLIQSFSAGAYSETRRSGDDMLKARMLHPIPWISSALWNLLTPDRYDYWTAFFGGGSAPAIAVTEVDWSASRGMPGYRDYLGFGPDYPMWGRDA